MLSRFRCLHCVKNGVPEKEVIWRSEFVTILFRGCCDWHYTEHGELVVTDGVVQMKTFAQACKKCESYETAEIDETAAMAMVKWLHRWIANVFHGYNLPAAVYRGSRTKEAHHKNRCEARQYGWCKYCNG